jgi:ribosomal protein S21
MNDNNSRYDRNQRRNPQQPRKRGENQAAEVVSGDPRYAHIIPVQAQPLQVIVHGAFDKALRAFRALVQKERILSTYKERQSYEKPSDRKRRKRIESIRNQNELNNPRFQERGTRKVKSHKTHNPQE